MRLASSFLIASIGLSACGGSDDFADSTDELGSANTQAEAEGADASSSSSATDSSATGSSATDSSATDSTAGDTGSSTDAGSSSSGPGSDSMDAPMDGPSTHADATSSTDGVVETDGGIGGECMTACDCLQGLGCTDTFVCAPVPDNAYCCEKDGCPAGVECVFSDGTFGVCV